MFLAKFLLLQWDVKKLCFEYDTEPYYQALDIKVKVFFFFFQVRKHQSRHLLITKFQFLEIIVSEFLL